MKLKKIESVELTPTAPFNFDATFHKPDHFPSQDYFWQPRIKWQTMVWQGRKLGLKMVNTGSGNRPKIIAKIYFSQRLNQKYLESLKKELIYRYSLDFDLTKFNQKFKNDPQLAPIIKKWKGMRVMHYGSLYEYLIVMIMLQNCTVKRSVNMLQALFENYGTLLEYNGKKLWAYWEPKDLNNVTEEELRNLKLGYRAKFIKKISQQFANGEVDEFEIREMSKEEQRQKLLSLYGIGPASVHNLSWEVFRHYDKVEKISPWEQKIYSKLFFNRDSENPVSEEKLLDFFEKRFGKYQILAVHYIWEDLWWQRKNKKIAWLEKLIRV